MAVGGAGGLGLPVPDKEEKRSSEPEMVGCRIVSMGLA